MDGVKSRFEEIRAIELRRVWLIVVLFIVFIFSSFEKPRSADALLAGRVVKRFNNDFIWGSPHAKSIDSLIDLSFFDIAKSLSDTSFHFSISTFSSAELAWRKRPKLFINLSTIEFSSIKAAQSFKNRFANGGKMQIEGGEFHVKPAKTNLAFQRNKMAINAL